MFENRVYLHVTHQSMQVMRSAYKLGIKHPGIDALMTKQTKTIAMIYIPMRTTLLMTTPVNARLGRDSHSNSMSTQYTLLTEVFTLLYHGDLNFFHCVLFMQFCQHQYSFNLFCF